MLPSRQEQVAGAFERSEAAKCLVIHCPPAAVPPDPGNNHPQGQVQFLLLHQDESQQGAHQPRDKS